MCIQFSCYYRMEYQIVKSKFGKDSIYVPCEKMLYVSKGRKDEYVCYQTILRNSKKKDYAKHLECTSRIRLLPNGLCERANINIPHSSHSDHEIIVSDKKIMENVTKKCIALKSDHQEDAFKIPNRHIFQREIARYILKIHY